MMKWLLCAICFAASAHAESRIVGSWKVVGFTDTPQGGEPLYPFGREVVGQFIYTADGHMSVNLMRNPPDASAPPQSPPYVGYFGTYTVNSEEHVVIHHVVGASLPNYVNTDQRRPFKLEGDKLIIGGTGTRDGKTFTFERVLVREK